MDKPGMQANVLDIPPVPPSILAQKCTDQCVIREACQYYASINSFSYMGVVYETPIPRLSEIAFNLFPGPLIESQRQAAQLTGGARFNQVVL